MVILSVSAAALTSIGIGILLSLFAKTAEGASSLSTVLGLMLSFTAGIWFPREWMPSPLQLLASYFPITWSFDVARAILIYERPLSEVLNLLLGSLITAIAIYSLGMLVCKETLRRYLEKS